MAQVYPEDRGTNYAIRDGRAAARLVADRLARPARDRHAAVGSTPPLVGA